jgi:hypothetical protein
VYNTIEYNTIYTMSLIESVFELDDNVSFNTNRKKQDILKVSPVSGTVWGSSGVKAFEINNQQHYLLFSEAYLYGEVELRLTGGDDKITLENNWFPRCFSHMILRIGGKEIEGIHNAVGEASTLSNFVMTSNAFRNAHGQIAGWVPDTMKGDQDKVDVDANMGYFWRMKVYNQKKKFSFIFPLKYLFGFCTDYNKILYLIKIRLELNLKPDSEISPEVFYGDAGTTGKIKFNRVDLHVPYIEPSLEIEEIITKRLSSNKPIDVIFLKRTMNTLSIPTGEKISWTLGNYTNAVRFVFVCFKKDPSAVDNNNALFTADGIKSLRLQLNGLYYPVEGIELNYADYNLAEVYKAYIEACETFGVEPQLNLHEYRDLHPIFAFDCSSQPDNLKSNGIQLTLHINKDSTKTYEGFALLLEDARFTIATGNGSMIRIE